MKEKVIVLNLKNAPGLLNICLHCLLASPLALKCSANKGFSLYNVTPKKWRPISFFNNFWPILKILQILGFFPTKKSTENLCGFEAMPTAKYLVLTVVTLQLLGLACHIVSYSYVMATHNLDLLNLMCINFAIKGSPGCAQFFGTTVFLGSSISLANIVITMLHCLLAPPFF